MVWPLGLFFVSSQSLSPFQFDVLFTSISSHIASILLFARLTRPIIIYTNCCVDGTLFMSDELPVLAVPARQQKSLYFVWTQVLGHDWLGTP